LSLHLPSWQLLPLAEPMLGSMMPFSPELLPFWELAMREVAEEEEDLSHTPGAEEDTPEVEEVVVEEISEETESMMPFSLE